MTKSKQVDERLLDIIRNDVKLSDEMKLEFLTLGGYFTSDFKNNLLLTSIDLDEKYEFGIDAWKDFLAYAPIKRYIDTFVKEIIGKNVDNSLATGIGVRDAIGVKKELDRYSDDRTNENFVVFMMPQKEDEVFDFESEPV